MIRLLLALALVTFGIGPAMAEPDCEASGELLNLGAHLSHLAVDIADGHPAAIVAIGSSSTWGVGASSPDKAYPPRFGVELSQRFGLAFDVLNKGVNGESEVEMLQRFGRDVAASRPMLVIWQVGSNTVFRNIEPEDYAAMLRDGIARIRAMGADVVLMSPQYAPAVLERPNLEPQLELLAAVARETGAGLFRRFDIMRAWNEKGAAFEETLSPDRFHMNDWSYGCVARLLADAVVASSRSLTSDRR